MQRPGSKFQEAALNDQASLLYYVGMIFAATGIGVMIFIVSQFRPLERPLLPAACACVLLSYTLILSAAQKWRRHGNAFRFLRLACFLYVGLGTSWGILINGLLFYSEVDQRALAIGLALGVVSTPIICVPAIVAFSFFVPVAVLSIIGVAFMDVADPVTVIAFTIFTLYAVIGIVGLNTAFLGRSDAQIALQREVSTVSVFLREYQEGSPDWLWETDAQGHLIALPLELQRSLNREPVAAGQLRLQDLFASEDTANYRPKLETLLSQGQAFRENIVTAQAHSRQRWFTLTGHPVHDERGELIGFRGIGRDITERYEADMRLAYMARHDGLTGLLNRKAFVARVEESCSSGDRFALLSIDLDDFKGKNDNYGHHVGDAILVEAANRIRSMLRSSDAAGRLGGDEFAVLICNADLEMACASADALAKHLAEPATIEGQTVIPGATLGVAASGGFEHDAKRVFLMADLALYKAKLSSKGEAVCFEPHLEDAYLARLLQEQEFLEALDRNEISVAYQPIADLMTGQVMCVEALARWYHPKRGAISPAIFVETAERGGLIDRLGEAILRRACKDAAQWPDTVQINVNLSPKQLISGRFPALLARVLEETGLPPSRLGIEITENVFIDFADDSIKQLRTISSYGVKIILDDFGTGYSSLSYLMMIEVDGLKIDASFLRQLPDRKVEAIIRTVARLTADLNIYLVAEGIEQPEHLAWLRENGIQFGQGFLLGRPRADPPLDFIDLAANTPA
ncbi:EAL domain-containing protein [Tianweitania sp. BSSL-BM11]|uniref:EAL domain-containing protein n=1 Tax=Tianweitania aestuarii TaxID=2814886 RepID=A0ABS5RVX1_9HYPH|nr:EAL domain-containing protein [Tianweitania aestuarii]MBS9721225.1 EAL domain-containing protein [Tianweitania aestuarii]